MSKSIIIKNIFLSCLTQVINNFKKLNSSDYISHKEMRYLIYEYKKAYNLGKLYLLPKIHKILINVTRRAIIFNCGTPTEKVSYFFDYHLKPVMQNGLSYISDSQYFLEKIKTIGSVSEHAILVTAYVVGLYPILPIKLV